MTDQQDDAHEPGGRIVPSSSAERTQTVRQLRHDISNTLGVMKLTLRQVKRAAAPSDVVPLVESLEDEVRNLQQQIASLCAKVSDDSSG